MVEFGNYFLFKVKLIYECIMEPALFNYYVFLILQGITMPTFYSYSYFFNIDVLHISLFVLGILPAFAGLIKASFAYIYPRHFA